MIDIVQRVLDGQVHYEWEEVRVRDGEHEVRVAVMADALKIDGVPPTRWTREARPPKKNEPAVFDGVRWPVAAHEQQEIADLLYCMFMTPKLVELCWQQAQQRFDPVLNLDGHIVATSDITDVHQRIEKKIADHGGYLPSQLRDSIGKHWVLVNKMAKPWMVQGDLCACNHGWPSSDGQYRGVLPGVRVWQSWAFAHNKRHWDPSQTCRLVYRLCLLKRPDGVWEETDLHDVLSHPLTAGLLHHDGVLTCLRQPGVHVLEPLPGAKAPVWREAT